VSLKIKRRTADRAATREKPDAPVEERAEEQRYEKRGKDSHSGLREKTVAEREGIPFGKIFFRIRRFVERRILNSGENDTLGRKRTQLSSTSWGVRYRLCQDSAKKEKRTESPVGGTSAGRKSVWKIKRNWEPPKGVGWKKTPGRRVNALVEVDKRKNRLKGKLSWRPAGNSDSGSAGKGQKKEKLRGGGKSALKLPL